MSSAASVMQSAERVMAKEKPKVPDQPVRIDADLVDMVDFILRWRKKRDGRRHTAAEYLSPMVRAQIESDYAEAMEESYREFRGQSKKKP